MSKQKKGSIYYNNQALLFVFHKSPHLVCAETNSTHEASTVGWVIVVV